MLLRRHFLASVAMVIALAPAARPAFSDPAKTTSPGAVSTDQPARTGHVRRRSGNLQQTHSGADDALAQPPQRLSPRAQQRLSPDAGEPARAAAPLDQTTVALAPESSPRGARR